MAKYFTPTYVPKRNGCLCPSKDIYNYAHSNTIHNSPKLESTQKPSAEWTNCGIPTQWNSIQPREEKQYELISQTYC